MTESLQDDPEQSEVFKTGGQIGGVFYSGKLIRTEISHDGLDIRPANWTGRLFRVPTVRFAWTDVIRVRPPGSGLKNRIMCMAAFEIRGRSGEPEILTIETWGIHRDRLEKAIYRFVPSSLILPG